MSGTITDHHEETVIGATMGSTGPSMDLGMIEGMIDGIATDTGTAEIGTEMAAKETETVGITRKTPWPTILILKRRTQSRKRLYSMKMATR